MGEKKAIPADEFLRRAEAQREKEAERRRRDRLAAIAAGAKPPGTAWDDDDDERPRPLVARSSQVDPTVWEEPPEPEPPRDRGPWARRLRPLMDRPGEWARVHVSWYPTARQSVRDLKKGVLKLPTGTTPVEWEFEYRRVDEEGRVYARYVGSGR